MSDAKPVSESYAELQAKCAAAEVMVSTLRMLLSIARADVERLNRHRSWVRACVAVVVVAQIVNLVHTWADK